jgi:predicted esterase
MRGTVHAVCKFGIYECLVERAVATNIDQLIPNAETESAQFTVHPAQQSRMRILMLHGFAQDGNTFQRKTSKLVHSIRAVYPNAYFAWPDGPVELHTTDIPGFETRSYGEQSQYGPQLRAWFHLRYVASPPSGLSRSLDIIADVLKREGPFDGIIAFSQGTLLAGMVASLLQGERRETAHCKALSSSTAVFGYPEAFRELKHPPLKFGVLYATRVGREHPFQWLYEGPKIPTPFCLVSGKWDPMVEVDEQRATLDKLSSNGVCITIEHDGGHFVPTDARNIKRVVNFICDRTGLQSESWNVGTAHAPRHSRAVNPHELRRCLQKLESAVHDDLPLNSGNARTA